MQTKKDKTRHEVRFEPVGVTCAVEEGRSVLEAAQRGHVPLRSDCGGKGVCGKCQVITHPGDHVTSLSDMESQLLQSGQMPTGCRLACQAEITGPITVTIPPSAFDFGEPFGKTGITGSFEAMPLVHRTVIEGKSLHGATGGTAGDLVTLIHDTVNSAAGREIFFQDPIAIRELSRIFPFSEGLTVIHHRDKGVTRVVPGTHPRSLGIALDIGTTTVAAYVCDLSTGAVLTATSITNPQRYHGEDVISRISFAAQSGTKILHELIIEGVNSLVSRSLGEIGAEQGDVDEVTVVGNTTMLELFAGLDPRTLGLAPYRPAICDSMNLRACDVGLNLNPGTNIHIFPVISGFVGGDTVGAIIAEQPHLKDEITLIVDIGTNGEVILGNRVGLWATSCATGPALEGVHISCGMRATIGAIHKVAIDPASYQAHYEVLGGNESSSPRGLCGSGVIDAVAAMRAAGVLLPNGRIKEDLPGVISDNQGIGRRFIVVPGKETATSADIVITLDDVRQIQLAKAALSAGITLLMRRSGIDHIDTLILTGAFGARFDWKSAVAIGMLPPHNLFDHVKTVENAPGLGAIKALLNGQRREEALRLSRQTKFIELAEDSDFVGVLASAMTFPGD